MTCKTLRLGKVLLLAIVAFAFAAPAYATVSSAGSFTVHGWDLGEKISLQNGIRVWTAELDVSLDDGPQHTASFCVDLDSFISGGVYEVRDVLPAYTSPSPIGEALRNFAWAGHVMDNFGYNVDLLTGAGVTRDQAITGVQAAIWEGIYFGDGDDIINVSSLSMGAQLVYRKILASVAGAAGSALVVEMDGYQDQVIRGSAPVPEPSAALVFAIGALIMGRASGKLVHARR